MSNNLTNPGHSIIRAAEEDSGGGGAAVADSDSGMGLVAGLDKFLEENPDATAKEGSTETAEPISSSEESVPSDDSPPEKAGDVLTEQEDDFDKIYKGEISKSGAAILPSKRARRLPEKIITAESNEEKESTEQDKQLTKKDSIPTDNKAE